MITLEILQHIAPLGSKTIQASLVDPLNELLPKYDITNLYRITNFLGQACEESDEFKTLQEYASGAAYEGRRDLGNIHPGDGRKYKGRGIFQITGAANYAAMAKKLGIDLINHPELAETAHVAVETACIYWQTRDLNVPADKNDMITITHKINGGYNGLSQRRVFTIRAMQVIQPLWTPEFFKPPATVPPVATPIAPAA